MVQSNVLIDQMSAVKGPRWWHSFAHQNEDSHLEEPIYIYIYIVTGE